MLDSLDLHIPFQMKFLKQTGQDDHISFYLPLETLPSEVPLVASDVRILDDGSYQVLELKHAYESLSSAHSGMAMKIYHQGMNSDPFVALKCSPCKLLQGHNLYGFEDVEKAFANMMGLLASTYPLLYDMLDPLKATVSGLDITYSVFVPCQKRKMLFLDHLRSVSKGQTKNRGDAYATSIYFGAKTSRLKKLKVYSKCEEMIQDAEKMKRNGYTKSYEIMSELINTEYAKSAVRFEATIKSRYLERRAIPIDIKGLTAYIRKYPLFYRDMFLSAWSDIFVALGGQELTVMNDDEVFKKVEAVFISYRKSGKPSYTKVNRVYSFYTTLKNRGFEGLKRTMPKNTFNDNVRDLCSCGISRSYLQNLHKDSGAEVIKLAQIIEFDFDNQLPPGYQEPLDLFEQASSNVVSIRRAF